VTPHAKREWRIPGQPPMQHYALGVVRNHMSHMTGAKGSAHAENMNTLEQARLAATIVSRHQVYSRSWFEINGLEVAQTLESESI